MRRAGRVPAGHEAGHRPRRPGRPEDEVGPAVPGAHRAVRAGRRLQRAGHGGADRDHPPACLAGELTSRAVASGTRNRSGCGGSPGSCEDTPVCSTTGATATPRVTSSVTTSIGERPPGARHLRAARLAGEDGLVLSQRPRARHVGVADRPPVAGEEQGDPAVDPRPCLPQPGLPGGPRPATMRAAPASRVITSPGRRSVTGPVDAPAGRTSTTHAPSSSSAEKCTSTGAPARLPSTAAGKWRRC